MVSQRERDECGQFIPSRYVFTGLFKRLAMGPRKTQPLVVWDIGGSVAWLAHQSSDGCRHPTSDSKPGGTIDTIYDTVQQDHGKLGVVQHCPVGIAVKDHTVLTDHW
jgi:hypothetical protein